MLIVNRYRVYLYLIQDKNLLDEYKHSFRTFYFALSVFFNSIRFFVITCPYESISSIQKNTKNQPIGFDHTSAGCLLLVVSKSIFVLFLFFFLVRTNGGEQQAIVTSKGEEKETKRVIWDKEGKESESSLCARPSVVFSLFIINIFFFTDDRKFDGDCINQYLRMSRKKGNYDTFLVVY
jgi:hypothetical protein